MNGRLLLRLLPLLMVAALALGACGSDSSESGSGEDIYRSNCASCHGTEGGGGLGPRFEGVAQRLTPEEHLEIVNDGKGSQMPAWKDELSAAEIDAVIEYERTDLNG